MSKHLHACLTKLPSHQAIVDTYGGGDVSNLHVARAAFLNDKEWPNGYTIKIAFLKDKVIVSGPSLGSSEELSSNWTQEKQDFVIKKVNDIILPLVNLNFDFNSSLEDADVRISFNEDTGAWCYAGTECKLSTDIREATMNLGWLDNDVDYDELVYKGTGIVVLHEFGHLLGLIHEHSREDAPLDWNKKKVEDTLAERPNYWSPEMCERQIFNQAALSTFNGSVYDPKSVMHYYFPNDFFNTPPNLPKVTQLSELDRYQINLKYPGKELQQPNQPDDPKNTCCSWLAKFWYFILIALVFVIGLYIVLKMQKIIS
jgi:serralysin